MYDIYMYEYTYTHTYIYIYIIIYINISYKIIHSPHPMKILIPGYLSPSMGLKFSDVPNGLAAISKADWSRRDFSETWPWSAQYFVIYEEYIYILYIYT